MRTQEQRGDQVFGARCSTSRNGTALRKRPELWRGYLFKSRALILPPDDDESLMIANLVRATNGPEHPVDHVV